MGDSSENNYWLSSWLSAAKVRSSEVLEFVKKDLEEFGSAVKNEATSMVSTTGTVLEKTLKLNEPESTASTMKRSFSSFLGENGQMNNVLNPSPSPDDSDTEAILITEGSETVKLTKLQQAVYELQKNEKTFLDNPDPSLDKQYQCWLEIIDDQLTEERLTKHLTSSVTLNNQYLKLVPDNVPHQLFWKRYLFKKALLEDELARQEAMERRELKEKQMTEEHLKWDQEDFATDIELSEEEQIRLLQQYEEETKQKTQQKQKSFSPKELIGEKIIFKKKSPKKVAKTDSNTIQSNVVEERKIIVENEKLAESEISVLNNKKLDNEVNVPDKTSNDDQIATERKEDHFNERNLTNRVSDLKINKTGSSNSLDIETKSSNSSSDGDWEKISDVDK